MISFTLRFPPTDIPHWAARYDAAYDAAVAALAPAARARGFLTGDELRQLASATTWRPTTRPTSKPSPPPPCPRPANNCASKY